MTTPLPRHRCASARCPRPHAPGSLWCEAHDLSPKGPVPEAHGRPDPEPHYRDDDLELAEALAHTTAFVQDLAAGALSTLTTDPLQRPGDDQRHTAEQERARADWWRDGYYAERRRVHELADIAAAAIADLADHDLDRANVLGTDLEATVTGPPPPEPPPSRPEPDTGPF